MSKLSPTNHELPVGDDDANGLTRAPSSVVDWSIPPQLRLSTEAFRRDLPELLRKHEGKWAAYCGDRRLGITLKKSEAFQIGFDEGLTDHEFVVLGITSDIPDVIDGEDFSDV